MTQTTLIANGTVVTADGEFAGDVLIEGETIAAVGRSPLPREPTSSMRRGASCCRA